MKRLAGLLTLLLLFAAGCRAPLVSTLRHGLDRQYLQDREPYRLEGPHLKIEMWGTRQPSQTESASFPVDASMHDAVRNRLANPDLDVLLIVVGVLLLYLEFNIPGTVVPGALGLLAMLLGLYGLSQFPLQSSSAGLIFIALVLIALELKLASHGVLALIGTLTLAVGLSTLIVPGDATGNAAQVHTSVALGAGIGFGVISFGLGAIALRARRNKTLLGPQAMLGKLAVARTPLSPAGQVEVRGELWQATLRDPSRTIPAGAGVLIREIDGLTLIVDPT